MKILVLLALLATALTIRQNKISAVEVDQVFQSYLGMINKAGKQTLVKYWDYHRDNSADDTFYLTFQVHSDIDNQINTYLAKYKKDQHRVYIIDINQLNQL